MRIDHAPLRRKGQRFLVWLFVKFNPRTVGVKGQMHARLRCTPSACNAEAACQASLEPPWTGHGKCDHAVPAVLCHCNALVFVRYFTVIAFPAGYTFCSPR